MEPGGETAVDVEVRDAAGNAVAESEIAVVVVDEAILGLTGYKLGDPIATFYSQREADTNDYHLRKTCCSRTLKICPSDGGSNSCMLGGDAQLADQADGAISPAYGDALAQEAKSRGVRQP